jgi:hypothetical protein
LDHSGTVTVSENNNRLDNGRRWMWVFVFVVLVLSLTGLAFEHELSQFLAAGIHVTYEKSFVFYADLLRISIFEMLWCGLIALLALLIYNNSKLTATLNGLQRKALDHHRTVAWVFISLISVILLFNAIFVLQQFPNSADEYVYLYQAETLSKGKLWEIAHPLEKSFSFNHIAVKDGISVGRFPVGWPLILAIFIFVGIPAALVNPLLAIVTLIVFYNFSKRLYGIQVAQWALVVVSLSGFFIFNSSSFFSHTSCLLETLIFVYCVYNYLEKDKIKYGLLAGLALGLIMLIRYYTAFLIFLPFCVLLIYNHKIRAIWLFVLIGIGALPCLIGFFLYNYAITGNALTPVTVWGFKNEGLGFINGHTVLKGFEHILRRLLMFVYWCSPVFLIFYFYFIVGKIRNPKLRFAVPEDYIFISFMVGYFFYYEIGGNQYGPRFYYEGFPFLILFVVNCVFRQNRSLSKILLYVAVIVMVIKLPFIALREHQIVDQRQDVYDLVRKNQIQNAVVIITTGTCDIRPMPAGDLTRNDAEFTNDVLYAVNDPDFTPALIEYYKDRNIYKYVRQPDNEDGELIRIR